MSRFSVRVAVASAVAYEISAATAACSAGDAGERTGLDVIVLRAERWKIGMQQALGTFTGDQFNAIILRANNIFGVFDARVMIRVSAAPRTFSDELHRLFCAMKIYNMRYHLAIFPKDLVRSWWKEGDLPAPTSQLAYLAYKAGFEPRRRLYRGPPHKPQLKIIDGGKATIAAA